MGRRRLAVPGAGACETGGRSCSRARRARCSTSITAPIPYVTSSNATIGGVCTGLGVGAAGDRRRARRRQGLHDARRRRAAADRADRRDGQPAARERQGVRRVTGRPRRCGWYDAVAVRYAARVNGLDALALTKLDVLDGLERAADLHGVSLRRRDADRVSGRHRAARGVRAGLRIDAGLDGADRRRARVRRLPEAARRTSRGSRR